MQTARSVRKGFLPVSRIYLPVANRQRLVDAAPLRVDAARSLRSLAMDGLKAELELMFAPCVNYQHVCTFLGLRRSQNIMG
jgi:hypothetical protein